MWVCSSKTASDSRRVTWRRRSSVRLVGERQLGGREARWLATDRGLRGFHCPDLYSESLARGGVGRPSAVSRPQSSDLKVCQAPERTAMGPQAARRPSGLELELGGAKVGRL